MRIVFEKGTELTRQLFGQRRKPAANREDGPVKNTTSAQNPEIKGLTMAIDSP